MRKYGSARFLFLLFSGLFVGIGLVQIQRETQFSGIFSEYFLSQYASLRIDTGKLLAYVSRCRVGQYMLLVCLGGLTAASAALGVMLFGFGILLGTILSVSALRLSLKGILICAVGVLPQLFFYIPAFGWVFLWIRQGGRSRRKYLYLSLAGALFLFFGILTEVYVNPPLLQRVLRGL
ncbi:MAG: hypothetical protein LIO67_10955 [Lachnospiraceae bacterium]|nr:hypothetical protein [Lachnospiraceae bacterium]